MTGLFLDFQEDRVFQVEATFTLPRSDDTEGYQLGVYAYEMSICSNILRIWRVRLQHTGFKERITIVTYKIDALG